MRKLPGIFCFDMDGTITDTGSSWEHLSRELGIWDGNAEHHLTAFLEGRIDYMEFCRMDALILRGKRSEIVRKAISTISIDPDIESLAAYLRNRGVKISLISSGLSLMAERLLDLVEFDYVFVNELEERDGVMTGGVKVNVSIDDEMMTKRAIIKKLKAEGGFEKKDVAAVGDNWGDHGMLEEAGMRFFVNRIPAETQKAAAAFQDIVIVNNMAEICRYFSRD